MSNNVRVTVTLDARVIGLLDALGAREMPNGKKYGRTGAIYAAIVAEAARLGVRSQRTAEVALPPSLRRNGTVEVGMPPEAE